MAPSFQDITLDTNGTDDQAVLVLREGRVTAVLSHLGEIYGDMAGMWFLETMFATPPSLPRHMFADPEAFVAWLDEACVG
jgi:hypothetical protein